jgi:hypothetical protein
MTGFAGRRDAGRCIRPELNQALINALGAYNAATGEHSFG